MIRYEDPTVECAALSGQTYVAIPFEIYQSVSGKVKLTVYKACKDIAKEFLSVYGDNPLHKDGIMWAARHIQDFMIKYGYQYDAQASDVILEFAAREDTLKMPDRNESVLLKTTEEWFQYENATSADPDFLSPEKGVAFAAVRDGEIISCACINDMFYADGAIEIQVDTVLQYRNCGLGYMYSVSLIKYLCGLGYTV